ncbi:MAG: hypothetical protein ACR2GU_01920 [Rubrobacteraceae bacterium]
MKGKRLFILLPLTLTLILLSGCGVAQKAAPGAKTALAQEASPGGTTGGGVTVASGGSETLREEPFVLNQQQDVPLEFKAAYDRKAPIVVQFYKKDNGSSYPEGLTPDQLVNKYVDGLKSRYPAVEFFTYSIDSPGSIGDKKKLAKDQYGTLAAQLGVVYTPFVATLAPRGGGYVVENLFEGYVTEPVLDQAVFDLASANKGDNTSKVDVNLTQVKLTPSGGGIDYFTVKNQSKKTVNLDGFSLRVVDQQSGNVDESSPGVRINSSIEVRPGESISVGRVPDVTGANGKKVVGTFEGGQQLNLSPGDQVALLDKGGAIADTFLV